MEADDQRSGLPTRAHHGSQLTVLGTVDQTPTELASREEGDVTDRSKLQDNPTSPAAPEADVLMGTCNAELILASGPWSRTKAVHMDARYPVVAQIFSCNRGPSTYGLLRPTER